MPEPTHPGAISVVMPAFNEADYLEAAVRAVLAGLHDGGHKGEVLVVENGSTDSTRAIAGRLAEELDGVRTISLGAADYGLALRTGLVEARGDVAVVFDVDYYDLEFLERALRLLDHDPGPAVVVASKRAAGASDRRSLPRRLITWAFAAVLRRGFDLHVSDTHGMKVLRRAALLPIVEDCRFGTDLFDTELVLRAERAGLAVAELPVTVEESRPSRSSIVRRAIRSSGGLVRLWLDLRPRRRRR